MSVFPTLYSSGGAGFNTPGTSFDVALDSTGAENPGIVGAVMYPGGFTPTVTFNGVSHVLVKSGSLIDYVTLFFKISGCGTAAANMNVTFDDVVAGCILHGAVFDETNQTNIAGTSTAAGSTSTTYTVSQVGTDNALSMFGMAGSYRTSATVTLTNPTGFTQIASTANLILSGVDRLSMRTFYKFSSKDTITATGTVTPSRPWVADLVEISRFAYSVPGYASPHQFQLGKS